MKHFTILGRSHYTISVLCDILSALYKSDYRLTIVSNMPDSENETLGIPFLADEVSVAYIDHSEWEPGPEDVYILGVMGNGRKKLKDFFMSRKKIGKQNFINLIHPSAIIPKTTVLGNGILIGPGVVLAPYVKLGDFVHLNRNVSIGHHSSVSHLTRINAHTAVSGVCHIGENVAIGPGSVILDKISIGDNAVIGASSMVNKDIPAAVVAYGSPAKVIRQIETGS